MLIFVFLVTDEHEAYFTTWFTGRIRFLFIYYTVSPYNRTKEISKNGKCFPCFLGRTFRWRFFVWRSLSWRTLRNRRAAESAFLTFTVKRLFEDSFVFSKVFRKAASFSFFQEQ